MELFKDLGWIPVGVVLIIATIVAGILIRVTSPPPKKRAKDMTDRERFELLGIGEGPKPGDDVEEYWRDFELLKQARGGRNDEYFRDDQI